MLFFGHTNTIQLNRFSGGESLRQLPARLCCVLVLLCGSAWCQTTPQFSKADIDHRVDAILSRLNLEQKIDLLGGTRSFYIRGYKDAGLPEQKMSDGPVGVRNYGPSTTMGGIGLAATWNPELVQRLGAVLGQDARA